LIKKYSLGSTTNELVVTCTLFCIGNGMSSWYEFIFEIIHFSTLPFSTLKMCEFTYYIFFWQIYSLYYLIKKTYFSKKKLSQHMLIFLVQILMRYINFFILVFTTSLIWFEVNSYIKWFRSHYNRYINFYLLTKRFRIFKTKRSLVLMLPLNQVI
jgi:hypothetical protein